MICKCDLRPGGVSGTARACRRFMGDCAEDLGIRMIRNAVMALSVVMASNAVAQTTSDPGPDKSGYTLFDPTPDDQMRAFCTDRPPKANAACTVDAGHFQYEADIVNWTYAEMAGVTTNTYFVK